MFLLIVFGLLFSSLVLIIFGVFKGKLAGIFGLTFLFILLLSVFASMRDQDFASMRYQNFNLYFAGISVESITGLATIFGCLVAILTIILILVNRYGKLNVYTRNLGAILVFSLLFIALPTFLNSEEKIATNILQKEAAKSYVSGYAQTTKVIKTRYVPDSYYGDVNFKKHPKLGVICLYQQEYSIGFFKETEFNVLSLFMNIKKFEYSIRKTSEPVELDCEYEH